MKVKSLHIFKDTMTKPKINLPIYNGESNFQSFLVKDYDNVEIGPHVVPNINRLIIAKAKRLKKFG